MTTAAVQQPVAAPGAVSADEISTSRRDTKQRIHDLEILAQSPEVLWVRKQMKMIRGDWAWSTAHAQIASGFLQSTTNGRLFASRDENTVLQISTTFPQKWEEVGLSYFHGTRFYDCPYALSIYVLLLIIARFDCHHTGRSNCI